MISEEHRMILAAVRAEATKRETAAGHNGKHHDDGAGTLRDLANAWEAGLSGRVPKEFLSIARAAGERQERYALYQQLKKEFGD